MSALFPDTRPEVEPDDPPEIIQRRMADLLLGMELAARVYRPLPEADHAG